MSDGKKKWLQVVLAAAVAIVTVLGAVMAIGAVGKQVRVNTDELCILKPRVIRLEVEQGKTDVKFEFIKEQLGEIRAYQEAQ